MEGGAGEVDGGEFGVGDFDSFRVGAFVEAGVDIESGACGRGADQVDCDFEAGRLDCDFEAGRRLAAPVLRDEAEQAVLDLVPFAGAGWEVADLDGEAGLVCELL